MKEQIPVYGAVAAGGFIGAICRYAVDLQLPPLWGTLVVNVLGCILMGMFMYESIYIGAFSRTVRIFFGAGFVGAFTTFSALAVQTLGAGIVLGLCNLAANTILGLAGIFVGRYLITYQRGI